VGGDRRLLDRIIAYSKPRVRVKIRSMTDECLKNHMSRDNADIVPHCVCSEIRVTLYVNFTKTPIQNNVESRINACQVHTMNDLAYWFCPLVFLYYIIAVLI
jgi:hypothetical protein